MDVKIYENTADCRLYYIPYADSTKQDPTHAHLNIPPCKSRLVDPEPGAGLLGVIRLVAFRIISVTLEISVRLMTFSGLVQPSSAGRRSFSTTISIHSNLGHLRGNEVPKKYSTNDRFTLPCSISPNAITGAATSPRLNSSIEEVNV